MSVRPRLAYTGGAQAWHEGPERVYDRLAEVVVDSCPVSLRGLRVVDIGAGTGSVSRVLRQHGALPTGVDLSTDMVEHMCAHGLDAVLGDILELPFEDGSFDAAMAAFAFSHVDDPLRAFNEARRVVRADGTVMVAGFAVEPSNPAKQAVDFVAERFGYARPAWYTRFKGELEPQTGTVARLEQLARDAGLVDIGVIEIVVDTGLRAPAEIVAGRIGMAHLAPFVAGLSTETRDAFVAAATEAVAVTAEPVRPSVLVLSSRVAA